MPNLSLWLLGPARIELDGAPLELQRRKTLAMLAYLAVTGEAQRRDSLAALLWPESDQNSARSALRRDLSELNRALGQTWLEIGNDTIRLPRAPGPRRAPGQDLWLDMDQFRGLLAACGNHGHPVTTTCPACLPALSEAVTLYRGDFLVGFSLRDSPAFDEWQFFQAEALRQEAAAALERLARGHSAYGEEGRALAIPYARRWLALDPLHEPAHCLLMQLYAGTGQYAAALRQYAECVRVLNDELGVPPAEATVRLYETLKAQRLRVPPAEPGGALPANNLPGLSSGGPAEAPFAVPAAPPVGPRAGESLHFVAHEHELARLGTFLDLALAGGAQPVFIAGEAGSGKTTLVQEFTRRAQLKYPGLVVAGGNCNAFTGVGDPYLPFREILGQLTGDPGAAGLTDTRRLHAVAARAIQALLQAGPDLVDTFVSGRALVARAAVVRQGAADWPAQLKTLVARHEASPGPANLNQLDLFEQYVKALQVFAEHDSLALVLDDLQWADTGSINLLFHLGRRLRGIRILIVGIYRPEEVGLGRAAPDRHASGETSPGEPGRHPLESLVNEFQRWFGDILIDMGHAAGRHFVDALLDSQPNQLGLEFRTALHRHTRGHALFTVEMLRGMQERGDLVRDEQGRWIEGEALNWEILPARVEGVIGERIGRLPPHLREVLKVASVEGEVFTAEVVARVQMMDERLMIRLLSGELDGQYRLIQNQSSQRLDPGGQQISIYRFRHILFQKYLYNHLDEAECTYLHEAVGQVLEHLYGQQTSELAVQFARHFEAAGWPAKAIAYLHQAGEKAVRLSANDEALVHFTRGLKLLATLPPTPERDRQELTLQIALFAPLAAVTGYGAPEVGLAYTRARELCYKVDDARLLFQVSYGLWGHNLVRAQFRVARELAHQCLVLAEDSGETALLLEGNRMVGETAFHRGELAAAREHLARSRALYDPQQHRGHATLYGQDPGVALLSHGSWALWHLGYPDQALAWSKEARALAQEGSHPFSLVFALEYASMLHQRRGEVQASLAFAEEAIAISTAQGFVEWLAMANGSRAWIPVEMGEADEGIRQLQRSLAAYRATGSEMFGPYFLTMLARAHIKAGQADAALAVLDEALATIERTEGYLWHAECCRLAGEVLVGRGRPTDEGLAEARFLEGLTIAARAQARSLELRAATSLARLCQGQGRLLEARQMLASVYGWFTEGFDTVDLKDAAILLRQLGAG